MVINIAVGIVLGVFFLVVIVLVGYTLMIAITKHTSLTDEYTDVEEWFNQKNFADTIERKRFGRKENDERE